LLYDEITEQKTREGAEMPKAFWKGVISFGMVVIPVKMYVATEPRTIEFHLLHKKCLTRPKQVLHCERDEEYFTSKDTVRGYEYAKDQFVVLDEEDFKKVPVKTAHSINILGFVESREVDTIYYQNSHYIEPEELGAKPFALLKEVLSKTGRVGIAKVAFQRREHLCALRPLEDIMELNTLFYQNEIVSHSELAPAKQKLTPAELEMATSLVTAMATSFKPEEYKDEYHLALKKMVDAKLKGVEIKMPKEAEVEIPDLMSALKASLEAAKKRKTEKQKVAV
jgi:DNA end-binding protein Ku